MTQHKKIANDSNTTRIAVLENTIGHIHETLERIDKRFDNLEKNMFDIKKETNDGFSSIRKEMNDGFSFVRKESSDHFRWTIELILLGIILPIALKVTHVI